jgi:CubicO group peptidase (beta-lactamase class C family)
MRQAFRLPAVALCIALGAAGTPASLCAQTTKADSAAAPSASLDLAEIEQYAQSVMQEWRVPGMAIAIIKGNEIVMLKGFGVADRDTKRPVTPDTQFIAASTTKAFTSFGIGLLVDEGKLSFDTPVRSYIPAFRMQDTIASDQVTLRDMLSHRTGLPRHDALWENRKDIKISDLPPLFANLASSAPLRSTWQYNNMMYMTSGYIAQLTAKAPSWEDYTRDRILTPLNMTRTNFSIEAMKKDKNAALGYGLDEKRNVVPIPYLNVDDIGPAGSMNTTVQDMAQWLRVHINGGMFGTTKIIAAGTLADMHNPIIAVGGKPEFAQFSNAFYGMGWFVDSYRGHKRVQHGGNLPGFTARVTLFPDDGIGTVILMNMQGSPLPGFLSIDIAERQLGLSLTNWGKKMIARRDMTEAAADVAKARLGEQKVPGTNPSHNVKAYAGRYAHPSYGPLNIDEDAGRLRSSYNGITLDLDHWHYDLFDAKSRAEKDRGLDHTKFAFDTDFNGQIAAVRVTFEPAVDPIVFLRQADPKLSNAAHLKRFTGRYQYLDQIWTMDLAGTTLLLAIPGQGSVRLKPDTSGGFVFESNKTIGVAFQESGDAVTGFALRQPNGIFEIKKLTSALEKNTTKP